MIFDAILTTCHSNHLRLSIFFVITLAKVSLMSRSLRQPLSEGMKYAYVKGERRVASAATGKVLSKADEAKERAEQKKKQKWDQALSKYMDVGKESDHQQVEVIGDGPAHQQNTKVYTAAERSMNLKHLGEELAGLRSASYLAPQQKERKQTLDRLVSSLRSRGITVLIPGEAGLEGLPTRGSKRERGEGEPEDGDVSPADEYDGDGDDDDAALKEHLKLQGGAGSDAEALQALKEKRRQHHTDMQTFLYGGGGGYATSTSVDRMIAGEAGSEATASAAHRMVNSQISVNYSSSSHGVSGAGHSKGASFIPRSVLAKVQRQQRSQQQPVASSTHPTYPPQSTDSANSESRNATVKPFHNDNADDSDVENFLKDLDSDE